MLGSRYAEGLTAASWRNVRRMLERFNGLNWKTEDESSPEVMRSTASRLMSWHAKFDSLAYVGIIVKTTIFSELLSYS